MAIARINAEQAICRQSRDQVQMDMRYFLECVFSVRLPETERVAVLRPHRRSHPDGKPEQVRGAVVVEGVDGLAMPARDYQNMSTTLFRMRLPQITESEAAPAFRNHGTGRAPRDDIAEYAMFCAHHEPVFAIDAQGSCGGRCPSCSNSIEIRSGERTKAICPSRGGRLIV